MTGFLFHVVLRNCSRSSKPSQSQVRVAAKDVRQSARVTRLESQIDWPCD